MTDNPLAGYFRKPAVHMTLPSGGQFYPPGSLEMPPTGELPVYPMSALDEISYKTPDALFNGSAVIDVIKSCIPAIKDPWQMSAIDLPAILTNIRIASFGHMMEIDTQCPKCKEGYLYCSYYEKRKRFLEQCTNCNYKKWHRDRRKNERRMNPERRNNALY